MADLQVKQCDIEYKCYKAKFYMKVWRMKRRWNLNPPHCYHCDILFLFSFGRYWIQLECLTFYLPSFYLTILLKQLTIKMPFVFCVNSLHFSCIKHTRRNILLSLWHSSVQPNRIDCALFSLTPHLNEFIIPSASLLTCDVCHPSKRPWWSIPSAFLVPSCSLFKTVNWTQTQQKQLQYMGKDSYALGFL